jgi:7-cyano-7-deazaguanine synthase
MTNTTTIAITGANGFLGTSVAIRAMQQGLTVHGVVRSAEAARNDELARIKVFVCAGYTVDELANAFQGATAVIHLVATASGTKEQIMDVNVKLLCRVVDASRKANVKKIVYISGLGVGVQGACSPALDSYLQSKDEGEALVRHSGLAYTIFRPSFIIGPGDWFTRVVVEAISGGHVHYPAREEIKVQPISIDDAAKAIINAAIMNVADEKTYDLVGSEAMTVEALIMAIYQAIRDLDVNISPPVITRVMPGTVLPNSDESFEFLGCMIQGDPTPFVKQLDVYVSPIKRAIVDAVTAILKPNEKIPEKRAVMLLSGGLDSVTTLYWMRTQGYDVIPLSMHYHDRPSRELKAVDHVCKHLGIKVVNVPVPYIMEVFELKLAGYPVPSLFGSSDYYVPYRNLVFNTIAAYFADVYGARHIISGHITSDPLPDASQPFFTALEQLVAQLKVGKKAVAPKFLLPLKGMTKADVVRLGITLGVPFEWTWSCAFDELRPCGHCKPCRERAEGFKEAGIADPVFSYKSD